MRVRVLYLHHSFFGSWHYPPKEIWGIQLKLQALHLRGASATLVPNFPESGIVTWKPPHEINTLKFNDQIKWYQWWRGTYLIIQVIQLLYNFNNEDDPSRKKYRFRKNPVPLSAQSSCLQWGNWLSRAPKLPQLFWEKWLQVGFRQKPFGIGTSAICCFLPK